MSDGRLSWGAGRGYSLPRNRGESTYARPSDQIAQIETLYRTIRGQSWFKQTSRTRL